VVERRQFPPLWAFRFLVWGSSAMGSALVGVLLWLAHGINATASSNEKRIEKLETILPYQFKEIREKLDQIIDKGSP
jgi:NADPH:quinone reductase-like Zn-dependent oxidoreductase